MNTSLNNSELATIIKHENINFIASAITPWHAHSVDASIRYLQSKGVKVKGIIFILPAIKGGVSQYIINESHFTNDCCKLYTEPAKPKGNPLRTIGNYIKDYKAVQWYNKNNNSEQVIYIAKPWFLDIARFEALYSVFKHTHKFCNILLDEGLASYSNINKSKHQLWVKCRLNRNRVAQLSLFIHRSIQLALLHRFEIKTKWMNLNLLKDSDNGLVENADICNHYKEVTEIYAKKTIGNAKLPDLNDSVIIGTMAFAQSQIKDNSDVETLKSIVDKLKSDGVRVYIKPHPRECNYKEKYESLGCQFIEFPHSMETLMSSFSGIRAIISFSSTSLITANVLYGIESISIINMLELSKYGEYIQGELNDFRDLFSNFTKMPSSLSELSTIIQR